MLRVLRRNVILQAALALLTIALTIVLVFSLTAAWYTNVVRTGGLGFQAEAWEFDGEIQLLNQNTIAASPGDEGVISLRIDNDGEHLVAASATMDKSQMSEDMKKRLFFYVDTTATRNGETMERVYISEMSSYTYTIPPHSALELSETVRNGPVIKWTWVYDVLGYYVWGQSEEGTVTVSDYIRPVEYAYDPITTVFDGNGKLTMVDGTPLLTLLNQWTAADGYAGTITEDTKAVNGYYPVSVNSEGYGVWLYLCTKSEIDEHTETDTNLGSSSQPCNATVVITGANSREDSRPVTNPTELQAALEDPTAGIIRLVDDVEMPRTLTMTGGSATIDLGGNTLTVADGTSPMLDLREGAKLSLMNGTLRGAGNEASKAQTAVYMKGAHLTMNDVIIEDVVTGVRVEDHKDAVNASSTVYIHGGKIQATMYGLFVYGNSPESTTRTQVTVRQTSIDGAGYAGVIYNGTYGGIDTLISESTVTGYYAAIYHPMDDSTLTVEQSTLEGGTALAVKGGIVTLTDSTIHGIMKDNINAPAYAVSGWTDTGDGIYLEASYADLHPERTVSVTVTNCTVTSDYAHAVRRYQETDDNTSITVVSGTFTSFAANDATLPGDVDLRVELESYLSATSKVTLVNGKAYAVATTPNE